MLRAYLVDMTVLRDYSRALLGLGFFVAVCVSLGMQTSVMAPACDDVPPARRVRDKLLR